MTVMFMVTSSAPACSQAPADASSFSEAPSTITYFDFGGYALYSVLTDGTCAPGKVATYLSSPLTGPGAPAYGVGTPASPVVPMVQGTYTAVSVGPLGATVYVNGLPWARYPHSGWGGLGMPYGQPMLQMRGNPPSSSNVTTPVPVRFFGGNQATSSITLHDLQIYDFALTAGHVGGLSRGQGMVC